MVKKAPQPEPQEKRKADSKNKAKNSELKLTSARKSGRVSKQTSRFVAEPAPTRIQTQANISSN